MHHKSKGVDNTSSSNQINHPNRKGHRINNSSSSSSSSSKFLFHTMFLLALISQGGFLVCLREAQDTHNL
jgi:hypothetical protein